MDFYEVLERVLALLQRHRRVSYRALKVQFALDDDHLGPAQGGTSLRAISHRR